MDDQNESILDEVAPDAEVVSEDDDGLVDPGILAADTIPLTRIVDESAEKH